MSADVDERQFSLLQRKLEALNYTARLDPGSANLVQQVVDDLINTTDSYRAVKLSAEKQQRELNMYKGQVDGMKKHWQRAKADANALHMQIVEQAESFETEQREQYKRIKELEREVAELTFWKQEATRGMKKVESEKHMLKDRLAEVLGLGFEAAGTTPGVDIQEVSVVQAVEERLRQAEGGMEERAREVERLTEQVDALKAAVAKRDDEIARLGAQLVSETDPAVQDLFTRNEANEALILSLTQQVEQLTARTGELQEEADALPGVRAALEQAQRAQHEAEQKVGEAAGENQRIQEQVVAAQVAKLKADVTRIKVETGRRAQHDRGALAPRAQREESVRGAFGMEERLRTQLRTVKAQREAGQRREDALRKELGAARAKLDATEKEVADLSERVAASQAEVDAMAVELQRHERVTAAREGERAALERELENARSGNGGPSGSEVPSTAAHGTRESQVEGLVGLEQVAGAGAASHGRSGAAAGAETSEAGDGSPLEGAVSGQRGDATAQQTALWQSKITELQGRLSAANEGLDAAQKERDALECRVASLQRDKDAAGSELANVEGELKECRRLWQDAEARLAGARGGHVADDLAQRTVDAATGLGRAEADAKRARHEAERHREAAKDAEERLLAIQGALREAERDRSQSARALEEVARELSGSAGRVQALESANAALREELDAVREALKRSEAALARERGRAEDAALRLRGTEHVTDAERFRTQAQAEDLRHTKEMLEEAERLVDEWRGRHQDATADLRTATDNARQAASLADKYEEEARNLRAELDEERRELANARVEARRSANELAASRAELEQLRSLALEGDRSHSDLESRVASQAAALREAQVKVHELLDELQARSQDCERAEASLADRETALRQLDQHRDELQAELDDKVQELAGVHQQLEAAEGQAAELQAAGKAMERRLVDADRRAAQLEQEVEDARGRDEMSRKGLEGLQQEFEALQVENGAISEDLAVMVKENQIVSGQLGQSAQDVDRAREELQSLQASAALSQQTVKARELELEDVRAAYSELSSEHRQVNAAFAQLEREKGAQGAELEAAREEVQHLQDVQHSHQLQLQQYVVDVGTLERNNDALARELQGAKNATEDCARDRDRILEQMKASQDFGVVQKLRYECERGRDALQRDVATLDSQLHIASTRLAEAQEEVRGAAAKHALATARIGELEGLLETMRAREFSAIGGDDRAGPRVAPDATTTAEALSRDLRASQQEARQAQLELATVRRQLDALREATATTSPVQGVRAASDGDGAWEVEVRRWKDRVQALELELGDADRAFDELKSDKERLLAMVSRLELDKRRLEAARSSGSPPPVRSAATDASDAPGHEELVTLHEAVRRLEAENAGLRDNAASLQQLVAGMQRQVADVHREHAATDARASLRGVARGITASPIISVPSSDGSGLSPDENRDP